MLNTVSTDKLKEHHKNGFYFTDIEGEKYEEVKRSIETNGIRDPIKCTMDYTVFSGHQRLRIARDLGIKEVPVQFVDVDENTAEYLLIAENVERRGQAETDPIKVSRILKFIEEYWFNKGEYTIGRGNRHNAELKTQSDLAEFTGESIRTTKRLLSLNDLIPEIQQLVSSKKLGTTAAEQLTYLSVDEQHALFENKKGDFSDVTVEDAKRIKKENEQLRQQLQQERNKPQQIKTEVVERVVEVDKTDYNKLQQLQRDAESYKRKFESAERMKELLETRLQQEEADADAHRKLKDEIESLQSRKGDMYRQMESAKILGEFQAKVEAFLLDELAPKVYSKFKDEIGESQVLSESFLETLDKIDEWLKDMRYAVSSGTTIKNMGEIIEAEVVEYE